MLSTVLLGTLLLTGSPDDAACRGACCFPNQDWTFICALTDLQTCNQYEGMFAGYGTTCSPEICGIDPVPTKIDTWGKIKMLFLDDKVN